MGKQIIENLELPDWIHLILVTDGFYGPKKNITLKLLEKGIDVVSRLRIDAAIYPRVSLEYCSRGNACHSNFSGFYSNWAKLMKMILSYSNGIIHSLKEDFD